MSKTIFITLEGGEYTGKSGLVGNFLKHLFNELGIKILYSREPGGSPRGEKIREEIFTLKSHGASPWELVKKFNEARNIHLEETIVPFQNKCNEDNCFGAVVLDRYLDSTLVYQCLEAGVPIKKFLDLNEAPMPDLTYILYFSDIPKGNFASTLFTRGLYAGIEKNSERSNTSWDSSSINVHVQRQSYYLSLPEYMKMQGIDRNYEFIDTSLNPLAAINSTLVSLVHLLEKLDDKRQWRDEIVNVVEKLLNGGHWNYYLDLYSRQKKLKLDCSNALFISDIKDMLITDEKYYEIKEDWENYCEKNKK